MPPAIVAPIVLHIAAQTPPDPSYRETNPSLIARPGACSNWLHPSYALFCFGNLTTRWPAHPTKKLLVLRSKLWVLLVMHFFVSGEIPVIISQVEHSNPSHKPNIPGVYPDMGHSIKERALIREGQQGFSFTCMRLRQDCTLNLAMPHCLSLNRP